MKTPNWFYLRIQRPLRFWWQRRTRGFDDSELWGLDGTIARFTLPRLKRFRSTLNGCPHTLTYEQWGAILDKMIFAMEFYSGDHRYEAKPEEYKAAQEGLDLFATYFCDLWD